MQSCASQTMELILNLMSTLLVTFWLIIWIMHLCALYNAKLKLNNQNLSSSSALKNIVCKCRWLHVNLTSSYKHDDSCHRAVSHDHVKKHTDTGAIGSNSYLASVPSEETCPTKQQTKSCCLGYSIYNNNNNNSHNDLFSYTFNSNPKSPENTAIDCMMPVGVSIIKPLLGVDSNLKDNLETFFHLNYPLYEVLFCVQDKNDEAIPLVEELFKKYPKHDIKLFIGDGTRVGVNPKINNMQPAYEACKYQLILISDSGISMKQDTLSDMVNHMRDDVALVHQMPFVKDGRTGFQSIVERVYFGTAHARAYLTADLLNINCPTGMSALMRRCLLDEVGGIKAFGQYLAEDFFFAKSFTDRGWKISISSQPALQNSANSSDTFSTLNSRIQRWVKLRFAMVPFWTLLEPFSECILLGLLSSLSLSYLWAYNPLTIFISHVMVWFLLDYKLLCMVQNGPLACSKVKFIAAWLLRECSALVIYLEALARPKVIWRSRTFKLRWGGYAEEIGHETAQSIITNDNNRKCSIDSLTDQYTFLEKSESIVEDNDDADELEEKASMQQVVRILDADPSEEESDQSSSWLTTISTILDTRIITPVLSSREEFDGFRAKAQNYDKSIMIDVDCNKSTLNSNQHQLMDIAILAQA